MSAMTEPKHDWTNFWDQIERYNQSPWTTSCPTEDKDNFERKVEGMVRSSVPKHLEPLSEFSPSCTWHWTAPAVGNQKGGAVSLEYAILVASYTKETLDVQDVLVQLPGQVYRATRVRNGVVVSRQPEVVLPFPEDVLRHFIHELKHVAFLTFWKFVRGHRWFLRSLPRKVESTVCGEVFEIAVREIMDVLNLTCNSGQAPLPPE